MADFNDNSNGVFGGVNFDGSNSEGWTTAGNVTGDLTNGNNAHEGTTNNSVNAGVFGNFETGSNAGSYNGTVDNGATFEPIAQEKAITKQGLWTKIKAFLFQEIDLNAPVKVELTPYQQKVEDEINEFLHQEVSFKGFTNLFKSKK